MPSVVGAAVGSTDGTVVGAVVGSTDGTVVGAVVGSTDGTAVGAAVGCAVGIAVGCEVGIAVGSSVGSGTWSVIGPGAGSYISKNLFMNSQKLSHQLFQSKKDDSDADPAVSFAFCCAEDTELRTGVTCDSMQVPFTTWASVQFSA
jgi:hypothetical protein